MKQIIIIAILFLFLSHQVLADEKFVGAGSCSSSNCHGNSKPRNSSDILQNEFFTWFKHDKHSKAFKVLYGEDAKKISYNLGLADPTKEKMCLDCHTTNAPIEKREEKFFLEDGVTCESCHGAAGAWLKSHAESGATHSQNVLAGMKELSNLSVRAELCSSCHFGDQAKKADHDLIGSGHPRLEFDLDTFEAVEPRHWSLDSDYDRRKGPYIPTKAWVLSQITLAQRSLEKLSSETSMSPDFSNYYCYSCHHSLADQQWKVRDYGGKPGELRLNLSNLMLLKETLTDIDRSTTSLLEHAISNLHQKGNVVDASRDTLKELQSIKDHLSQIQYSQSTSMKILKSLLTYGRSGKVVDYQVAEQIAMGIDTLLSDISPSTNNHERRTGPIFAALKNQAEFNPANFREALLKFKENF